MFCRGGGHCSPVRAYRPLAIRLCPAADDGKAKTALIHDKEAELMDLMYQLAHYIEDNPGGSAANKTEINSFSSISLKQKSRKLIPAF